MCLTFVSMSRGQALPRSITFALIFGLGCIAAAFSSVPSSKRSAAVKKKKKVVLVDMDGVLCEFDRRAFEIINERRATSAAAGKELPDLSNRAPEDMTSFPLTKNFSSRFSKAISALFHEQGFFASFEPVEGAISALKEMQSHPDLEVLICTAPMSGSCYCHQEKVEWIRSHFGGAKEGTEWVKRMIITSDKSLVRGDILIDDAPKAKTKHCVPSWEHVWYERGYNRQLTGGRHLRQWADWRSVVL